MLDSSVFSIAAALGSGLLIGADRERRKGAGPSRSAAGLRTFAIASLVGAIAQIVGGVGLLAVSIACVAIFAATAQWHSRNDDPGITTEMALLATPLVGGLCAQAPPIGAGVAVIIAALLAAKSRLHQLVSAQMTEDEGYDALILAGASLILLPILPNRTMGPFNALNPYNICLVVVLVMAIGAAGHIAVRIFGVRYGLAIAGLASGFISSTATIAANGARARKEPELIWSTIAGSTFSTVATPILMAVVLGATSQATLNLLAVPMICGGIVAGLYATSFLFIGSKEIAANQRPSGRAFSIATAGGFAVSLSGIVMLAAWLAERMGTAGVFAAAALGGFVDTHAAAISVATLVVSGKLPASDAVLPILAAFSTNTASKAAVALIFGRGRFAAYVILGLVFVMLTTWTVTLLARTP